MLTTILSNEDGWDGPIEAPRKKIFSFNREALWYSGEAEMGIDGS